MSHRQLTARLEELTEEHSLQSLTPHPSSLLCEIEQSMEQEEQEQEREQVATVGSCLYHKDFAVLFLNTLLSVQLRLQLWEAYCEVRSLCSHLRGNDVTDSALSTDSSMDESSETSSAKDVPTGSIHTSLLELRRLTQNLLDGNESTVMNNRLSTRAVYWQEPGDTIRITIPLKSTKTAHSCFNQFAKGGSDESEE